MTVADRDDYHRGYRAGKNVTSQTLVRADNRGERPAWYAGFYDAEAGEQDVTR